MNQERILAYKMSQQLTKDDLEKASVAVGEVGTHLITGSHDGTTWDVAFDYPKLSLLSSR